MNRMMMMMGAALMAMAGCAPAEAVPVHGGSGHKCDASRAQGVIGKARSKKVGADALRRSGARTLRWIAPDTMVTMDFREDRLNLHVDSRGRVTKVNCG
jgi:hypothetical protein